MNKVRHIIGKLRGRSAGELHVRGMQMLHVIAERNGWSSLARIPDYSLFLGSIDGTFLRDSTDSAESLLEHFRTRTWPRFFAAFDNAQATAAELETRFGSTSRDSVIKRARRIAEGRFDLLGLRDLHFGDPVNWHLEPISGMVNSRQHWSRIDYLDAKVSGDKKITWELNRHQYFSTLGRAYWYTGDELHAQTFIAHINSWIDENPPKVGINWASSLEVALRSISWLWALYFFKDSKLLTPTVFLRILKLIYLHGRHLETYLSTYFSPNTHLTGEALGLFYLGTLLPEFRCAARWRTKGQTILLDELEKHVLADGVYFEQSSYYHRYTTDFYTHLLILLRQNNEPVEDRLEAKLRALLDHLMYITRPDGTTPLFGDDDGGRLVMLDDRPQDDFRSALATGAVLFARPDYKFTAGEATEETLWLLGPAGLQQFDSLQAREPARASVAFKDSGYYVMRDGWTPKANFLLFDCGPHGGLNCAHAHADALSFELVAKGRTLLVDPGTYTYTGSKEMRDWFRGSIAHNTLTIDGESSSVPDGPFSWQTLARCEMHNWISRDRFDYAEGTHDGYARLTEPASHTRSILFLKNDYWVIRDQVNTRGKHQVDLWFHFDSDSSPLIEALESQAAVVSERDDDTGIDVFAFAKHGHWRREDGWVSHCYGEKAAARVYAFSKLIEGNEDLVTFLLPRSVASETKPAVREVEAIGGKAFEITHENGLDIVMIRDSQSDQYVEMERLASDFAWTWAKFRNREENSPTELVLVGGSTLELEGRQILRSTRRLDYLVASGAGDQFRVETDEGVLDLQLPIANFEAAFAQLRGLEP